MFCIRIIPIAVACAVLKNRFVLTETIPVPLSYPPSQSWDGNDGPWSSFGVELGTPPQALRVFPATGGSSLWVVLPDGCTPEDPSDCGQERGYTYITNQSSTWSLDGLYQLPLIEESILGYSGNALVGHDEISLGWPGDGLPSLGRQFVAGFATKDFFLGLLGLTSRPENISTLNNPQLSPLAILKNQSLVPSLSWAYTAGYYNNVPKIFGSLTFGGYDTTRFVPNNLTFSFGADISRDLLVAIRSITSDTAADLTLSTGIFAFINSRIPDIWLPADACKAFEKAFSLVWDEDAELYLVDDVTHHKLIESNPNITFKLSQTLTDEETVDIVMPYGSFDLNASAPLFDTSTRYFPLKRAVNDSQYTLGRTFLQQAYVIVDYERSNFSVSQALFPDTSIPLHIVPILPPGEGSSSAGLSTAAIAGIVVGAVVIVVVAILAAFIIRRKQRGATAALAKEGEKVRCEKAELDAGATARHETEVHPLVQLDHGQIANSKISGSGPVGELSGGSAEPSELEGHMKNPGKVYDSASPYEAVGPGGEPRGEAYELPAADVLLPELESRLPAVPVEALRGL